MPTIAEIIAARKSGGTPQKTPVNPALAVPAKRGESLAEMAATREAMNRIDPPGKPARDGSARKSAGLVLGMTADTAPESRGQRTPVRGPEDVEERSLGGPAGEIIPMVSADADAETNQWHEALHRFETDLCATRDPADPETVWLALRHATRPELPLILLHRLPVLLWDAPKPPRGAEPY